MQILGIDFGEKKIGLAKATTMLAEVYGVIRVESVAEAVSKVKKVVQREKIEKIVVGISEGKTAEETRKFEEILSKVVKIPIVFQDETLSTQEAQDLTIEAGINRKKRKELEDAYTAAVILQRYLDNLK